MSISIHQLTRGIRKHLTKYIHSRKDFATIPAAHYRWSLYRTTHGLLGWLQVNIQECWTTPRLKLFSVSSSTSEDKWYLRMYKKKCGWKATLITWHKYITSTLNATWWIKKTVISTTLLHRINRVQGMIMKLINRKL